METTNRAIFAADNDEGIGIHLEREVISRLEDLAGVPGKKPALAPDVFNIGTIDGFFRIERGWQ